MHSNERRPCPRLRPEHGTLKTFVRKGLATHPPLYLSFLRRRLPSLPFESFGGRIGRDRGAALKFCRQVSQGFVEHPGGGWMKTSETWPVEIYLSATLNS
jgi:hypothetical protein